MSKLTETEISKSDVSGIFKQATELRGQPQGRFSKFFGQTPKDKIEVKDLQQAWQKAGYPDDVRDIEHILRDFGFDDKEIHTVMTGAFGQNDDGEYNQPIASPAVQKIADYAKKAGLAQDLVAFMQKEYGFKESHTYEGKVVVEDVRKIFDAIVHEERRALPQIIKDNEIRQLGRNKK
jgi:hypothetical protein